MRYSEMVATGVAGAVGDEAAPEAVATASNGGDHVNRMDVAVISDTTGRPGIEGSYRMFGLALGSGWEYGAAGTSGTQTGSPPRWVCVEPAFPKTKPKRVRRRRVVRKWWWSGIVAVVVVCWFLIGSSIGFKYFRCWPPREHELSEPC